MRHHEPKKRKRHAYVALLMIATLLVAPAAQAQQPTGVQLTPIDVPLVKGVAETLPDSDTPTRQLVQEAAALISARENGRISFGTYKQGIDAFRTHHPDFYGAFFGDPFYYDVRQLALVRQRQIVSIEVEPWVGPNVEAAFLCDPYAYDPLFRTCRGFSYARADFFVYPSGIFGPQVDQSVRTLPPVQLAVLDSAPRSTPAASASDRSLDRPDRASERPTTATTVTAPSRSAAQDARRVDRARTDRARTDRGDTDRIRALASQVRPAPEMPETHRETDGLSDAEIRSRIQHARERLRAMNDEGTTTVYRAPTQSSATDREAARERNDARARAERMRARTDRAVARSQRRATPEREKHRADRTERAERTRTERSRQTRDRSRARSDRSDRSSDRGPR